MESVKYLRSKEGLFEVNRTLGQDYLKTLKSQIGVNIGYDLHIAQKGLLFFLYVQNFSQAKTRLQAMMLCVPMPQQEKQWIYQTEKRDV